jgi:hypothetical protein
MWSNLAGAAAAAPTGSMSGGSLLASLKSENPYMDVVQYEHKNRTWSLQQVDYYSEALAIGFAENGLTIGDVVLSWLPAHFSETVGYRDEERRLWRYVALCTLFWRILWSLLMRNHIASNL